MKQKTITYILATFNALAIITILTLILTSCNRYALQHISDPINGAAVYQFRNRKGTSKTIVDTLGRFNYGMDKITEDELRELSK
jgi:hypothetical protein